MYAVQLGRLNGTSGVGSTRCRPIPGKRQREDDDKWQRDLYENDEQQVSNSRIGAKELCSKLRRTSIDEARGSVTGDVKDLDKLSGLLLSPQNVESKPSSILQPVNPANIYAVRDLMREVLRSIKLQNKDDDSKATQAFQTLLIYVINIINDPDEGKFRKIRISNPAFQDRVGRYEKGIEFLEVCGFERVEGSNFLVLTQEKLEMSKLKLAWTALQNALSNPFFGLFSA